MTSEEEMSSENKKAVWESYIEKAKRDLKDNHEGYHQKKKDVICKLANDLEENDMPLPMIAQEVVTALHDCDVSESYVLKTLDPKYKREYKKAEKEEKEKSPSPEVDDKKKIEQSSNTEEHKKEMLTDGSTEHQFNTKGMGVAITDEEESSSASESTTGPNGEEVEQEVELPKHVVPNNDALVNMIDELKHENEKLKAQNLELSEAVNKLTTIEPASKLAAPPQTTLVYHQQIPKILKAIQQSMPDKGLIFHWTENGYLQECEPGDV